MGLTCSRKGQRIYIHCVGDRVETSKVVTALRPVGVDGMVEELLVFSDEAKIREKE